MMFCILATLAVVSLVASQPIDTLKTDSNAPSEEVVFVPYSVKYVPVEVPIQHEKISTNQKTAAKIDKENANGLVGYEDDSTNIDDVKILSASDLGNKFTAISESNKRTDDLKTGDTETKERILSQLEDKLEADPSKSSEDYVLVPLSVLKRLEDGSSSRPRVLTKRQAPGRFPFGGGRRIARRPALVGYFNDYDLFPTVA